MSVPVRAVVPIALAIVSLLGCGSSRERVPVVANVDRAASPPREEPFVVRPFRPWLGDRWIGDAICYGPFRDGQSPGGPAPGRAELREDLSLMLRRWNLLRVYGADETTELLLRIIREDSLDMRVLLGLWIDVEERRDAEGRVTEERPDAREANRRQIETGVRLAAEYPELVLGVSVGNETQVDWSPHRVPTALLVEYIRDVRARVTQPVTTVDDRNYWNKAESRAVAREVDFITVHVHPLWGGQQLDDALAWTETTFDKVRRLHPDRAVVLGETGWATARHSEGEQATLIKGKTGEKEQAHFFEEVAAWIRRERIPMFFFEAFDETWKGGAHPDDVEKHWGLHHSDRSPKRALAGSR